jgi:hypothetical protein
MGLPFVARLGSRLQDALIFGLIVDHHSRAFEKHSGRRDEITIAWPNGRCGPACDRSERRLPLRFSR